MDSSIKSTIENTVSTLVGAFLYYDRKKDKNLPVGRIEQAVKDGILTWDDIASMFRAYLPGSEPDLLKASQDATALGWSHRLAQTKKATAQAMVEDLERQLDAAKVAWTLASIEEASQSNALEAAQERLEATR